MKGYWELITIYLKLAFRDKAVLFFNYLFPLIFFFIFAEVFNARESGALPQIVSMVLILGILGNGLWGAGIRVVVDREQRILRRFKVAPISASPILISSMVTGWLLYLPALVLILLISTVFYGMPMPDRPLALLVIATLGLMAFRGIGLILASVANSMQEVNILIQLIYMPMLFLTGVLFPLTLLPEWVQVLSQFLPATYLATALQAVFVQHENILQNWAALVSLSVTAILGTFISVKLFRWEKEDKVPVSSKLWVLAVLLPFLVLGSVQLQSRDEIRKAKILARTAERQGSVLIRDAQVFIGDGRVLQSGAVLVRDGKIVQVFRNDEQLPSSKTVSEVRAAGKTLLPGLIDTDVRLSGLGGLPSATAGRQALPDPFHNMSAYLYTGVTAVRSIGDPVRSTLQLKNAVESGERLGPEVFLSGPTFTAPGGRGTEYFSQLPAAIRASAQAETLRFPTNPDEARRQVRDLTARGVDSISVILDGGPPQSPVPKLTVSVFRAIADETKKQGLRLTVQTGDGADVSEALAVGASCIEEGSSHETLPREPFQEMAAAGICYVPALAATEAFVRLAEHDVSWLDRSLVQQVTSRELLDSTRKALVGAQFRQLSSRLEQFRTAWETAQGNLNSARAAGVVLATGSDAGKLLIFHGAGVHEELRLWVRAGIPAKTALEAATWNAARLLGAGDRIGLIKAGYDANLLLVDGNPLEDISVTEQISMVMFRGGRINRGKLFAEE
jgi:imidazolonepropionase-like amidohydrolase/ABC-type multidrug transport system permease subunit